MMNAANLPLVPSPPVAIYPGNRVNALHVCWMLHNVCNYKCSYCHEVNWGGSMRWLEISQVQRFCERLGEQYPGRQIHVSFTGGEPTIWPGFVQLCKFLRESGHDVGMTSNGSRSLEFWASVRDSFNWLCLSYHPELTKVDHFLRVVQFLAPYTRISVRLMMPKDHTLWERSRELADRLLELPLEGQIFGEYVPILENFGSPFTTKTVYEPEQEKFLQAHSNFVSGEFTPEAGRRVHSLRDVWGIMVERADGSRSLCRPSELVANDEARFQGWTCHAGLDLLFIDERGDIFRGTCQAGGLVGNILDSQVTFPRQPLTCPNSRCLCGTDIQSEKRRARA